MNAQRLRNLTTKRLHTNMTHIHQDIEFLVGAEGIMTHQIPNAMRALDPWLKAKVCDQRFWNGEYDTTHDGDYPIEPMNENEKAFFWKRYSELPSPFSLLGTGRGGTNER